MLSQGRNFQSFAEDEPFVCFISIHLTIYALRKTTEHMPNPCYRTLSGSRALSGCRRLSGTGRRCCSPSTAFCGRKPASSAPCSRCELLRLQSIVTGVSSNCLQTLPAPIGGSNGCCRCTVVGIIISKLERQSQSFSVHVS